MSDPRYVRPARLDHLVNLKPGVDFRDPKVARIFEARMRGRRRGDDIAANIMERINVDEGGMLVYNNMIIDPDKVSIHKNIHLGEEPVSGLDRRER